MLQMRTGHLYKKMRDLVMGGDLGEITRATWLITDWFRTWSYYASGGWRATWTGEGGGVLINQCPHNLDLMQWIVGMMPSRVTAVVGIGKMHPIETEDEVSAILEYSNGAVGHFVTSTGEAPGTNGLELGNAMLMAGVTRIPVELPVDGDKFELLLKDLQAKYGGKKTISAGADLISDIGASYARP